MKKNLYSLAHNILMVVFDFDGVFTDNRVIVSEDGKESVICNRSDGYGPYFLRQIGVHTLVISSEPNPVVRARCTKLKIPCIHGCEDKLETLRAEADKLGVSMEQTAFLGNDINDIECLKHVGLPACVQDSYPSVFQYAAYVTSRPGGHGAVREFCDFILEAKQHGE
ncbi:MAG: HAD hydrolase family protein [Candidatus Auribacterota bacterium]|jgi:YrbI family 3-deoxy-D-manno-octulosonate 8-phosphate phosphatase|uniref:3-deoxy-D-manno-octulosonate 8-phosphate phosphatase n=1 Tax=Candidatus Auribacter fodinae TaxID=2093366 RepID=A0A3A4RE17_9BACT|nr:MAG: 3-deoxy-D-manno-octulosonate 8-phosphate phosphatase [Candidatus Auribacter fodinae]